MTWDDRAQEMMALLEKSSLIIAEEMKPADIIRMQGIYEERIKKLKERIKELEK